jgi:hypothetical protein
VIASASVQLTVGDIFFAGGENLTAARNAKNVGAFATTELMDRLTRAFTAGPLLGTSLPPPASPPAPFGTPPTPTPLTELQAEEIGVTSDVLIVGGLDPNGAPSGQVEQWNYNNNFILQTAPGTAPVVLATPRFTHKLAKLPGNKILIIGGTDGANPPNILADCEIWTR